MANEDYQKHYQTFFNTVNHRIPNCGWYSDSILCQSRTFDSRTIRKPDFFVRFSSLDRFIKKRVIKNILFVTKRSRLRSLKNFGLTIRKPYFLSHFVPFLSGFRMVFNKMAAKAIRKPDTNSIRKMTIRIPDSPV
jgi:hypothetical protein